MVQDSAEGKFRRPFTDCGGIGDGGKNFRCLLSGLMLRGIGLTDAELKILGVMHAGQ
ncbi:hypothetical protein CE91St46_35400 [Eubacteriales bacterium]|nr:hypothetical protein CE91St46_35400 [Eubacteriales bacterium]GKH65151.1 hypothetical protein CE91St47_36200 [Eubacteriales bacterium]